MDLSIIIVNWNTMDYLRSCLAALERDFELATVFETETIVVDNASSDGSLEMLQNEFPGVKVLANRENCGFARANNQGIRLSSGRHILLLNSDTEIHPGALPSLVRMLDMNPGSGAVGPRLLNADGTLQAGCHPILSPVGEFWQLVFLETIWPRSTYPLDEWTNEAPKRVDVIKGACLMLRRAALDEAGLLDERYYMYTEEVDLCYRLGQAGWEVWYVPQAEVTHYGGASSHQARETMYLQLYRSKIQFFRKFGGERRARFYKILLAIAYLPRAFLQPKNRNYRRLLGNLRKL